MACGLILAGGFLVTALSGCSAESETMQLRAIPGEGGDENAPCVPEDCIPIAALIVTDCPPGTEPSTSAECVDNGGECVWEFLDECVPVDGGDGDGDAGDGDGDGDGGDGDGDGDGGDGDGDGGDGDRPDTPPDITRCETAFAQATSDATCFLGTDFDGDGESDGFKRWGWSNGPLAAGTSSEWPVYASAGQCDVSKGTLIGHLSVSYDGSTAKLEFNRVGAVVLDEEHIYVGNDPLPTDNQGNYTVAPGLYPIGVDLDGATSTSHVIGGLSGDIFVVYHAVVCP
jgi:hypothetical protein